MSSEAKLILVLILTSFSLNVGQAHAQLISPGELILGHEEWDNIDNCTSCHALGTRGVSAAKCLNCHFSIENRLNEDLGLHATFDEPNCATCHKDHFGRDFDAIRFDTLNFDHNPTGYELLLSHDETSCLSCHTSEFQAEQNFLVFQSQHELEGDSYLGLLQDCESCHTPDNVHGEQFELVACNTCHDSGIWDDPPLFDHDESEYPLTGEHISVTCESCHEPASSESDEIIYRPIDFLECSSCHEDEHNGTFGPTCASCHETAGWEVFVVSDFEESFDHDATGFELVGLHESATCASCHTSSSSDPDIDLQFVRSTLSRQYPHPASESCESCHTDTHDGSTDPVTCVSCHSEYGWTPSDFDVFRHQDETEYPLEGAHLAVICSQCHTSSPGPGQYSSVSFEVLDQTCEGCHSEDDPHEDQFAPDTCETCHSTETWIAAQNSFDHSTTDFALVGTHEILACASCHEAQELAATEFRGLQSTCASCHDDESPHAAQFGDTNCADCHDETSFRLASFDHALTGWPLEGAHTSVSCASCHLESTAPSGELVVQYRGVGTACEDCHGGGIQNE